MSRKVAVVGGGPAGLYFARLLKRADPALEVVVHERMDGTAETFGFGVGLTESTMRNLRSADPETAERVREASHVGHELRLHGHDGIVPLHGARNLAIGRARLLEILTDAAMAVGVEIRRGVRVDATSLDADVVVAADGVTSATRDKYAAEFGVRSRLGRSRFVWCGADFAVDSAYFSAARRGDSLFVTHAYPYSPDRSTFLIEVDDLTWRDSGLEDFDRQVQPGESDRASVALLEEVFASDLRGRGLLTNRTRWSRFTNLTLDTWSHENVVLLGDAAHTAHYTLGSGTKLALEDAIALAEALVGEASVADAFAAYEGARRPSVERFKKLAHRSQAWWDSYRHRHEWSADRLALSYMTRSGNLMLSDYAGEQLPAARRALAWLGENVPDQAGELEGWVLAQPLDHPGMELAGRSVSRDGLKVAAAVREIGWSEPDVWSEAADRLVSRMRGSDDLPILLTGPDAPDAVPARVDLAERLRMELSRPIGVQVPVAATSLAATAVAAGRADFVVTR
ncbi:MULTISPECIES: FAD-dependent monooxygenase [unclassified Nocardioides]|uniref:FAD-dependent monooxygenase n=1 Tax=unclassified Nocardioides TaxID=2615069 RepID=UPI0006FD4464|nr:MULTISPECIES: FAD-dependent monooxygenase [unclassified Nocardioides]KQY55493.1 hypothetical protein ASD30_16460 [Nocardioides sp. Root140]KRF12771.1 hypothetical protein ASH02_14665 [Nocardioides sp. Soil796]